MNSLKPNTRLLLLFLVGFVVRLIALPFSHIVDGDVNARMQLTVNWLNNPQFISEGVWLPLHYYFSGIAVFISGETVIAPKVLHALFACLTIFPLFHFTKREFSEKGAWFSVAFFLFCPVVFRNSFLALSGIPHAFFIACALNFMSKSIRLDLTRNAIYAGISMTIASGFRYEAWLLIAIFTGIYILFKEWKKTIVFWLFAMIFPAFWMIGNYMAHQDIFYGLSGAYNWNVIMEGVNDKLRPIDSIIRIIYFPFIWFIQLTPILSTLLIIAILRKLRKRTLLKTRLIWSIPFWIMFVVFVYKAFEGTLLLQQRFAISLILLSSPFLGAIFEEIKLNKLRQQLIYILIPLMLPLSYIWLKIPGDKIFFFSESLQEAFLETRAMSQTTIEAIPRIHDEKFIKSSDSFKRAATKESGVILDFISYEKTAHLAVDFQIEPEKIFVMDGSTNGTLYEENLLRVLQNHPKGIILLKCYSKFSQYYNLAGNVLTFHCAPEKKLILKPISRDLGVGFYEYKIEKYASSDSTESCLNCPEENSLDFFKAQMKDDNYWNTQLRIKAEKYHRSIEEQIELEAHWLSENPQ